MTIDNQKIVSIISSLDFQLLRSEAGEEILKAASSYYEKDDTEHLANLVIDRLGDGLLYKKDIRYGILDKLNPDKAYMICQRYNIVTENKYDAVSKLKERYKGTSDVRIKEFLDIFSLSEDIFLREKIIDYRVPKIELKSEFGKEIISKGVLHPYQINVKDQVAALIEKHQKRMMVQMPTGAGKTMTALELVVDFVRSHKFEGYIVWIVNSSELAEQAFQSFNNLWLLRGDRPISMFRFFGNFDNKFNEDSGVVFATFEKCNPSRGKDNYKNLCKKSKCVIVDEAHGSCANTYSEIINDLISYDATLIGLSATPYRNDPKETNELQAIYGSNLVCISNNGSAVEKPIEYLQEQEYLARIIMQPLDTYNEITEVNEGQINKKLMMNAERNKLIIEQIRSSINNQQSTIVFACTVDHVIALNAICKKENLEVDFIIGQVKQIKREEIFKKFTEKKLYVILNHEILSTGIDLPKVDKLILTRPIGSIVLYSQIMGRALRGIKNGGNAKNIIVNIQDNLTNFVDITKLGVGF